MHLTDSQCDRYFDVMDCLLTYVNGRFNVVDANEVDDRDPLIEAKLALIAHELWENVAVIDDFVRDNPYDLPQADLALTQSWKHALSGTFTVVRYQQGHAILMHESGVYSVSGVEADWEEVLGRVPAVVDAVLLPFEGSIVYDGFLSIGDVPEARARAIADEFEERCQQGVASTADEFLQRSSAYHEAQSMLEFEKFMNSLDRHQSQEPEVLPQGFHRGALAGLSGKERDEAVERDLDRRFGESKPAAPATREDEALNIIGLCTLYCGIVRLSDAYRQYCACVHEPMGESEFRTLAVRAGQDKEAPFVIWIEGEHVHAMHFTLDEEYVAAQVAQRITEGTSVKAFASMERNIADFRRMLEDELGNLDGMRHYLAREHEKFSMRPLPPYSPDADAFDVIFDNPCIQMLISFLDERIPDGQDDYLFADRVVEELVLGAIEIGDVQAMHAYTHQLGLDGCCADETRLRQLVANVYDNVPSWENNGWSPREVRERLTGRRMFYDERGELMKVGSNDPCPCGSGLEYRDCCGR